MADDSFIHLVNGYLEGKLDKEDLKRFLDMIEKSPANREILATNAIISRLIKASKHSPVSAEQIIMALPRHGDTAKLILDQIRGSENAAAISVGGKAMKTRKNGEKKTLRENRTPGIYPGTETPGIIYFLRAVTAMAACALVAFGAWRYIHKTDTSLGHALAMLDCRGGVLIKHKDLPQSPAKNRETVYSGDTIMVSAEAMAAIRYNDENTILKIQEGSILRLDDKNGAKNLFLKQGAVVVTAAPQPDGLPMTLTTPRACATVIGTRFSMKSTEISTFLDVNSGKVRIMRSSDSSSAEVSTGNRIEVNDRTPLAVLPIPNMVLGHLGEKQVEEMFQTMSTARAYGINTLTFGITSPEPSALPSSLRSAIATAHRANVKFYARLDIPKDVGSNYDSFMNRQNNRLAQLLMEYNFDGIYVTRPAELTDNNLFKKVMTDVYLAVNNTGVSIETGVQREVGSNDAWFIGY